MANEIIDSNGVFITDKNNETLRIGDCLSSDDYGDSNLIKIVSNTELKINNSNVVDSAYNIDISDFDFNISEKINETYWHIKHQKYACDWTGDTDDELKKLKDKLLPKHKRY